MFVMTQPVQVQNKYKKQLKNVIIRVINNVNRVVNNEIKYKTFF